VGKWDKIIARLGLLRLGEEPKYQEKVDALKTKMRDDLGADLNATYLANMYLEARNEKDDVKEQLSEVDLKITALEQLITERFEVEDVSNIRLASGALVNVQNEPYASVEDRDLNRQWAIDSGLERSLQLPWATLNSHVKELLPMGEPIPPGVKLWVRTTVRLTRGGGDNT
jgi:hypothetical protein